MSYIRWDDRHWTDGEPFYAYSAAGGYITAPGQWTVPDDEWVEVTMRMLERGDFDADELEAMYETLRDAAHMDVDPAAESGGDPP